MTNDEPIRLMPKFVAPEPAAPTDDGWPVFDDYEAWPLVMRDSIIEVAKTIESSHGFGKAWQVFERSIRSIARKITPDKDERDDLIQIAMITLWLGDATRYNFRLERDVVYVRAILIRRMYDAWGMEANHFRTKAESVVADLPRVAADDERLAANRGSDTPVPC